MLARIALLTLLLPGLAKAATQDISIINRTGYRIDRIYISESGSRIWGNNVLGVDHLENTERTFVAFDTDTKPCRWDLKVTYHDATQVIWQDLNICETRRLALFWDEANRITVARGD